MPDHAASDRGQQPGSRTLASSAAVRSAPSGGCSSPTARRRSRAPSRPAASSRSSRPPTPPSGTPRWSRPRRGSRVVDDRALDLAQRLGDARPGIVAVCSFVDVTARVRTGRGPARLVTAWPICADVRDPGNAGTIVRTADALGADAVVLAGHSVDPYNPKSVRASVGSLFHLPGRARARPRRGRRARRREAGLVVLAADGAGELALVRRRGAPGRPDGLAVRQRGLGAAGRARGAGRPPGRGSRSTAAPRASTCHRRRDLPLRDRPLPALILGGRGGSLGFETHRHPAETG